MLALSLISVNDMGEKLTKFVSLASTWAACKVDASVAARCEEGSDDAQADRQPGAVAGWSVLRRGHHLRHRHRQHPPPRFPRQGGEHALGQLVPEVRRGGDPAHPEGLRPLRHQADLLLSGLVHGALSAPGGCDPGGRARDRGPRLPPREPQRRIARPSGILARPPDRRDQAHDRQGAQAAGARRSTTRPSIRRPCWPSAACSTTRA